MPAPKFTYATGRRKESAARVYLFPAESEEDATFTINNRSLEDYFGQASKQKIVVKPLKVVEQMGKFRVKVRVSGGGFSGQAGAVLHGLARALEKVDPDLRPPLKKAGLLTRDPRAVERKKPGRHKARKKPQFSKR